MPETVKSEAIKEVVNIDRVVHEPARLAILLALEVCVCGDFKFLETVSGLATSNLSLHLAKLEEHGLIAIERSGRRVFTRKRPRLVARLTEAGQKALDAHRRLLEKPKREAQKWLLLRQRMSAEPAGS